MFQRFSPDEEIAAITRAVEKGLARRRARRPDEFEVKARCDRCGRILADLLGDRTGIRFISAHRISAIWNDEGAWETSHSGPRPATRYEYWAGSPKEGVKDMEYLRERSRRRRFVCNKKCGADIPFRIEKLEASFINALKVGRGEISLPRDLAVKRI